MSSLSAQQATHTLNPTPRTVAWGYYDAKAVPVLRVKSGDTVEIQTLITNSPKRLEEAGVPPDQIEQSLRDITDQVKDKGPGGHILTGPIYIEGAEIGDVLEVKILAIKLAIPYAYNGFGAGRGYLSDDYPYTKMKIIPLDEKRMVAKFAPGIEIPLHPFFGSMGDAPPESAGRFNSAPPWIMAGNLGKKDPLAGTPLFISLLSLRAALVPPPRFFLPLFSPPSTSSVLNLFLPVFSASFVVAQHAAALPPSLQTNAQIPEWCRPLPRPEYKWLQRVLPDDP